MVQNELVTVYTDLNVCVNNVLGIRVSAAFVYSAVHVSYRSEMDVGLLK